MPRRLFYFLILALIVIPLFTAETPRASATGGIPEEASSVWTELDDVQREAWASGALDTDAEVAVADVVAGTAGIAAIGPIALVSGGVIAIDAVWKSGLGSSLGHWLANMTSSYAASRVTGEDWCPYVQPTWTGTYGTQTVTPPTPTCGSTSAGDYLVAKGAQLPPYGSQVIHLFGVTLPNGGTPINVGFNSDQHNYFTLDFHGGTCADVNNTGMFGGTGELDFSMFMDTNPVFWTGTHSGHQWDCVSNAWDDYTANYAGSVVAVENGSCVTTSSGSGVCGTSGKTCKQEAALELSTSADGTTDYSGRCYFVAVTEKTMADMLGGTALQPCNGTGQITCPTSNVTTIGSNTGTTNCGGQSPCVAALNKLDGETGECSITSQTTCGTPNTKHIHDRVDCVLFQTNCTSIDPITMPRPKVNETYTQYITRLRNLGLWGFIYETDDDMDYPSSSPAYALTPGVVTEIQVGTSVPIPIYWPSPGHGLTNSPTSAPKAGQDYPWPGGGNIPPDSTITILKVPDTWTGTGGPGTGDGGGPCNCPAVNFKPLTGIDYGTKFPFGAFTLLNSATDNFTGAGNGTPVSFNLPLMGSTRTISFQSDKWENDYRPIVFPIIEFLMTLGGVVWLALRLIGHPGGDDEGDG